MKATQLKELKLKLIECWLRGELVAELPQAAVGEKKVNGINKEIHESIMKSIWEIDWMVDEWDWIIDGMGPAPAAN